MWFRDQFLQSLENPAKKVVVSSTLTENFFQIDCDEDRSRSVRSIQEDNSLGLGSLLTVRRLDIQDDFIVRSDDMDVGDDEEDIRSTDFSDNLVLSVVRPGEVSAVL